MRTILILVAALSMPVAAAERWRVQYLFDEDQRSLTLVDLQFSSPQRGMAVGLYTEGQGALNRRPGSATGLVTKNGGASWSAIRLPALPYSLFLLDESGWLVARGGIHFTSDFGASWKKLGGPEDIRRVYFADAKRGWGVGTHKSVFQTLDGGRKWTRVPEADEPKTSKENTVYSCVDFASAKFGMIAGWSQPTAQERRRVRLPDWVDPGARRRELPAMIVLLQTNDGGEHWRALQSSLFGRVSRLRLDPAGRVLWLNEYYGRFEVPSEVYLINLETGKSERTFRRPDRAVTDIALVAKGPGYLAAVELPGQVARLPVPGKLRMLKSDDLRNWTEMAVDYRAVANQAILALAGADAWVATDTGMILKLVTE